MNNKLPMAIRIILSIAFLIVIAGLLTTTTVQSADLLAPNADATLKLVKSVTNNDGGSGGANDWTLFATAPPPDHDRNFSNVGGSGNFELVYADVGYVLSESSSTWTDGVEYNAAGTWSCDVGTLDDGSVITLTTGQAATCTITNNDIAPTLKLVNTVINLDGGSGVADEWTLSATAPSPDHTRNFSNAGGSGIFVTVLANAGYDLSESSSTWTDGVEYNAGSWSCDGGVRVGSVVTLAEGETGVTCTITNDDVAPLLTLIKDPTNDNSFTAAPDDFLLTVGGSSVLSGVANPFPANTLLAINETQLPGYKFVSITGDAKCPTLLGGTITMALGDVITCTITNNDVGFNITPTSGLLTSESGVPTATFNVALDTLPTADVTLFLTSSNTNEGTIDKSFLTFTPINWSDLQTVTITGVDDSVADGSQPYTIITGPVSTSDGDYGLLDPVADIPDVSVTNSDNDTPGFTVTPTTDLWVSEGGKTETIQVLLNSKPTSPVLLSVQSSDTQEGIVSIENALVDPLVWPQTTPTKITITGVDDCESGGGSLTLTITAASSDLNYNGTVGVLPVINYDAPTIGWVKPVGDEEFYISDGISPIHLEVISLCDEPISKVRFYRWVVAIGDHVTIGEDLTHPYQEILLPDELESGVNQIFAFAFGPPNSVQTFSIHKRIFIVMDYSDRIYMPLVYK